MTIEKAIYWIPKDGGYPSNELSNCRADCASIGNTTAPTFGHEHMTRVNWPTPTYEGS